MPLWSPPKTVLFDLDDTLFDHSLSALEGLRVFHARHEALAALNIADIQAEYEKHLESLHTEVLCNRLTLDQARTERFRRILVWAGASSTHEDAAAAAAIYRERYLATRSAVAGVISLLEALHNGYVVGVVTNNVTSEQREKLICCELDGLVDFMVTSEEVGTPKPGKAIFEVALERAGCEAHEAVMVGDSWHSDVLGAISCGIRAVWLNRAGLNCPDPALACEISAFEPLEAIMEAIGV